MPSASGKGVFLLLLLAAPTVAGAGSLAVRYVAGTGMHHGMFFCAHAAEVSLVGSADSASAGGACTVRIPPAARVGIEVEDAARGSRAFFYDLRIDGARACAQGWSEGPILLTRAPGCDEVSVAPEIGSLAGVVRLAWS